jgi:predicted  nucleic acid-binding Zn-ribbon protein
VVTVKICVKCGESFELHPQKPGLASVCPGCGPSRKLLPKEAKDAALGRKSKAIDANFRDVISDKRVAQSLGQRDGANHAEEKILMWDKARIKTKDKKAGSN